MKTHLINLYYLLSSNQSTISIRDYLVKPRLSFYDLHNGDVLTSLSGRVYLINVYQFETPIRNELIARLIPLRNLERKAINCQQLEVPDLNACNAQLIVFKSELNHIPSLSGVSLLEYVRTQPDLSVFNSLINFCGNQCKNLLNNFNKSSTYTILLPVNEYFNKAVYNFQQFSTNLSLLKSTIKSNIFYGSYCGFYLRNEVFIENFSGRKIRAKKLFPQLNKTDVYMSKSGIIAHKINNFFKLFV